MGVGKMELRIKGIEDNARVGQAGTKAMRAGEGAEAILIPA